MGATYVLWNKHMLKFRGNPEEMFGLLLQPILWVVLFGVGMKSMLGSAGPGTGDNYVTFMLPGIVALSALGGAIGGWMTKSMFQAVVIMIVGVLIGAQLSDNPLGWLGGLVLVALFGLGFSGIALSMASQTDSPGAYHAMIMVLNLPLLFLSNALYPLDTMPTWMKIGSLINPTTYTIDGLRQMMFADPVAVTGAEPLALWLCWLVVAIFAALGMWLAYTAFNRSIK